MYRHGFARQFGANNDPHRASLAAAAAVASIQQPHPTIAAAAAKAAAAQAANSTLPIQSITPRAAFTLEIEDSKPGESQNFFHYQYKQSKVNIVTFHIWGIYLIQ